jgi:hypothetical protein
MFNHQRNRKPALKQSNNELHKACTTVSILLDEANQIGALTNPHIYQLFEAAVMRPNDATIHDIIIQALAPYRIRNVIAPDALRPYPDSSTGLDQGDIEICTINDSGITWRVPIASIPHGLIVGPTGKGKSHLMRRIITQISGKLPLILITHKATDARLLADPPVAEYALTFQELRLSLFTPPPRISTETWAHGVVEMFARVWGLQLSRALLYECVDRLLLIYGMYSSKQGVPVAFTLVNLLHSIMGHRSKYSDSVTSALKLFTQATGEVFECSQGFDLSRLLLGKGLVLDISSLSDDKVARFVVDWLAEWIFCYFQYNGPNDGTPQFLIAMDDAQRFVSLKAEKDATTTLSHRYLLVRQAGIRFWTVSHCPEELAPAVLSQSDIIIQAGGMTGLKDKQIIGSALGILPSDWPRLQTPTLGEVIARENLSRCDRPFGGVVPPPAPSTGQFSEADRHRLMAPILQSLTWKPAMPLIVVERSITQVGTGAVPARMPGAVSQSAYNLADDILNYPWDTLSDRYIRLRIAGGAAQNAKDELLRLGWVREHSIPKQHRPPKLLEPLPPMCTALGRPMPSWSKGGFLHAFVSQAVVKSLRARGFSSIETEKFYGSKAVDIVALDTWGQLVGIEVTISLTNILDNLEKDLMVASFSSLIVVTLDKNTLQQASRLIIQAPGLKSFLPRIRVETVAMHL